EQLGAADDPRPGLAAELLDAPVQPDRDEHPRAADPAVRTGPPARGLVPDRVPSDGPRTCRRDHVLQRRARLWAAGRLRRNAGHRRDRRGTRGITRRAARGGPRQGLGSRQRRPDTTRPSRYAARRRTGIDPTHRLHPPVARPRRGHARQARAPQAAGSQAPAALMTEDLIQPGEIAYRLELTAA